MILLELSSFLELVVQANCSFTVAKLGYSLLISMLSLITVEFTNASNNQLSFKIIVILLAFLSVICVIAASYSFLKYLSNSNGALPGLKLKEHEKKYFVTIFGTLFVFYSIGMLLYNLSLVYADQQIAHRMTLMMYYLNNVCVYIMLVQDSVLRRLHCAHLQVNIDRYDISTFSVLMRYRFSLFLYARICLFSPCFVAVFIEPSAGVYTRDRPRDKNTDEHRLHWLPGYQEGVVREPTITTRTSVERGGEQRCSSNGRSET